MARPLRVEFPDACYHVICRGNFRFPLFADDNDKSLVVERLVEFAEEFSVQIRAYCVMVNHMHCHLRTAEANLGRYMQSFLTSFSVTYNRRHHTSGHVFQGRYKALLVEDRTSYCANVSRYIHLNPACIPSLVDAPFELRKQAIREYPWQSYGAVIGLRRCPRWLHRSDLLQNEGGTLRERQDNYAKFVEQGLTEELWDPLEVASAQCLIGSDGFVDRIRRGLTDLSENLNIQRESVQQRALRSWFSLEELIDLVADAYACDQAHLLRRRSRSNEARQVLLYLASVYCRGRYGLSELSGRLGPITVSALGSARDIMRRRMRQDRDLGHRVSALESRIAAANRQSED